MRCCPQQRDGGVASASPSPIGLMNTCASSPNTTSTSTTRRSTICAQRRPTETRRRGDPRLGARARFEYEVDGRERHEDIELFTPHYRGAHAASAPRQASGSTSSDPAGAAVVPRRIRASWRNSCDAATAPLFTYLAPSDVLMKRW